MRVCRVKGRGRADSTSDLNAICRQGIISIQYRSPSALFFLQLKCPDTFWCQNPKQSVQPNSPPNRRLSPDTISPGNEPSVCCDSPKTRIPLHIYLLSNFMTDKVADPAEQLEVRVSPRKFISGVSKEIGWGSRSPPSRAPPQARNTPVPEVISKYATETGGVAVPANSGTPCNQCCP